VSGKSDPRPEGKLLDKAALRQAVAALENRMGLAFDPTATGEKAQALMRALGIRPEDCILSNEILQMRREQADGE
jgi:hypothetical protein